MNGTTPRVAAAPPTPPYSPADPIVYTRLPSSFLGVTPYTPILASLVILIAAVGTHQVLSWLNVTAAFVPGLFYIALFAFIALLTALVQTGRMFSLRREVETIRRERGADERAGAARDAAHFEAIVSTGVWGPFRVRSRSAVMAEPYYETLRTRGVAAPAVTIAPDHAEAELAAIARPRDLLEPERIVASPTLPPWIWYVLAVMYVMIAAIELTQGDWFNFAIQLLLAFMFLSWTRLYRERLRGWRGDESWPLAAPGVVTDHQGRRWTVHDSVMLVRRRRGRAGVVVDLLGPRGVLRLSFAGIDEPDFIELWRRWNHPAPRPELLPAD
ncbi:MAG: hypothetical protein ACF8PN_08285 [Phycisphaerales bacterium]